MSANKTKAVVFDFDGTLSCPDRMENSWSRIWFKIGKLDLEQKFFSEYFSGKITYDQWIEIVVDIFKRNNVTKKVIDQIASEIKLLDNCEKVFKNLKEKGIKIFILSGGIKNIIEKAVQSFCDYITEIVAHKFVFDEKGMLEGYIKANTDIFKKDKFISIVMQQFSLKSEEIVFVGNDYNDEEAYKSGATTICINPSKNAHIHDRKIWNFVIEKTKNLEDILKYMNF